MPLTAGFCRREITPQEPCFLVGYPHAERISTGIHDPLFASAVCLDCQGVAIVLVSVDLLFIGADWTRRCRERIAAATGIAGEHVMIAATHTHSGPHTVEVLAWRDDPVVPAVDEVYLERACAETVAAAIDAWQTRGPAEIAWTAADVRGVVGGNRIDPTGPEDPEAGLLCVRATRDASPIAMLVIYGMHPTVLHADTTLVTSDFIGFARREIEAALPGGGVVYLNGVCGNQSPRRVAKEKTFAEAERLGSALGRRLVAALNACDAFSDAPMLAAASTKVPLEGRRFPGVADAEASLARARGHLASLESTGAEAAVRRTAECTVFGGEEVLTLARAEASGDADALRHRYAAAEVQVIRIGGVLIAAWPGELFVEYGLAAKGRAGRPLHVVTMANGELQGYIVTPEAAAAGGYESQMSLFPPEAGSRIVAATLALMEGLA